MEVGPLAALAQSRPQHGFDPDAVRIGRGVVAHVDIATEVRALGHVQDEGRRARQAGPGEPRAGDGVLLYFRAVPVGFGE